MANLKLAPGMFFRLDQSGERGQIELDDAAFDVTFDTDSINITLAAAVGSVANLTAAIAARPQKVSTTIAKAALVAAAHSQAFDVGSPLPANAIVTGCRISTTIAFTDGAAGVFDIDLGFTGLLTDLVSNDSLASIAVTEEAAHCKRRGGLQVVATVEADVNVSTATAGSVDIEVFYYVLA